MGGSGGGGFFSLSPKDLSQHVRDAETQQQDVAYETSVADFLATELAQYNDRNAPLIAATLEKIENDISAEIEANVALLFGGSVAKHTYVDGLSDIDALVAIRAEDASGWTPAQLKEVFAQRLIARFGRDNVWVGNLAVTVKSGGLEIQLLPAIRSGDKLKISDSSGSAWSRIDPRAFAERLTKANGDCGGRLVPTIKLAKAIISTFPEQRRLTGYHTEALALAIFEKYDGSKNTKAMLSHFFEQISAHIRTPIRDVTGQSGFVDEHLGANNSLERRIIADSMDRIARKMKNADGAKSLAQWKNLFENVGGENA
jgi:hypothetical protein